VISWLWRRNRANIVRSTSYLTSSILRGEQGRAKGDLGSDAFRMVIAAYQSSPINVVLEKGQCRVTFPKGKRESNPRRCYIPSTACDKSLYDIYIYIPASPESLRTHCVSSFRYRHIQAQASPCVIPPRLGPSAPSRQYREHCAERV